PCLDVKKSERPVAKEPSLVHDACVHQLALHGLHGVTPEGYNTAEHVAACLPGGHDRITCLDSHVVLRISSASAAAESRRLNAVVRQFAGSTQASSSHLTFPLTGRSIGR